MGLSGGEEAVGSDEISAVDLGTAYKRTMLE